MLPPPWGSTAEPSLLVRGRTLSMCLGDPLCACSSHLWPWENIGGRFIHVSLLPPMRGDMSHYVLWWLLALPFSAGMRCKSSQGT